MYASDISTLFLADSADDRLLIHQYPFHRVCVDRGEECRHANLSKLPGHREDSLLSAILRSLSAEAMYVGIYEAGNGKESAPVYDCVRRRLGAAFHDAVLEIQISPGCLPIDYRINVPYACQHT